MAKSPPIAGAPLPEKPPGIWSVICQLKRDLFGKDVENSATFTYDWLADQVGHFTLGFLGTFLLDWINTTFIHWEYATGTTWAVAIVLVFCVVEALDFLGQWRAYEKSSQVFQFNWGEILFNVVTAVYYIALGAVVAAFGMRSASDGVWAFLVMVVFFVGLAIWWLERKICFQQAGMPIYFRLTFFKNTIPIDTAKIIAALSSPGVKPIKRHLVISGPISSGKSTLAAAIGTEFAVRRRMGIGRYTTLAKLLQTIKAAAQGDDQAPDEGRILWSWQTSDLLIVDDVDFLSPPEPGSEHNVEQQKEIAKKLTDMVIQEIEKVVPAIRPGLKHRRTVWVVGDVDDGALEAWCDSIARVIGIGSGEIAVCRFSAKLKDLNIDRVRPEKSERVKLWWGANPGEAESHGTPKPAVREEEEAEGAGS